MQLLLIFVLLAASVALMVLAFAKPASQEEVTGRVKRLQKRLVTGDLKLVKAQTGPSSLSKLLGALTPLLSPVIRQLAKLSPPDEIKRELAQAGDYDFQPEDILVRQLLGVLTGPVLAVVVNLSLLELGGAGLAVLILAFAGLGAWLPRSKLQTRARDRQRLLSKAIPDMIDLLIVAVEAGLGLGAALQVVAEKLPAGPLRDELRKTLQEIQLGKPRPQALRDLGQRTGTRELQVLTVALVQAESMGTSLGKALRAQSQIARDARWTRAQEAAQKAPVKMVIPLALFIFPVIFIMIFGPLLIDFLIQVQ